MVAHSGTLLSFVGAVYPILFRGHHRLAELSLDLVTKLLVRGEQLLDCVAALAYLLLAIGEPRATLLNNIERYRIVDYLARA